MHSFLRKHRPLRQGSGSRTYSPGTICLSGACVSHRPDNRGNTPYPRLQSLFRTGCTVPEPRSVPLPVGGISSGNPLEQPVCQGAKRPVTVLITIRIVMIFIYHRVILTASIASWECGIYSHFRLSHGAGGNLFSTRFAIQSMRRATDRLKLSMRNDDNKIKRTVYGVRYSFVTVESNAQNPKSLIW
jgi:hypothetical protein